MTRNHTNARLEDILPLWRAHFADTFANSEVEWLRQHVGKELGERVDTEDPVQIDRISQAVRDAVARRIRESILPACLRWLLEKGYWDPASSGVGASNEVGAVAESFAPFQPRLPAATATVRLQAWTLPAALGAALGAVALTPLTFLLLNNREIGLFVGGTLGASGLVGLIGLLASSPKFMASLESGLKWFGIVAVPLALWRGFRGRRIAWVRAAVSTLGAWLVLATVRPRLRLPSRGEILSALEGEIRGLLLHDSDLVLALCWAHPDRLARAGRVGAGEHGLGAPVNRALRDLRTVTRDLKATREDLAESVESLLQRLEDLGFQWIEVERSSSYSESLEPYFEKYGMIDVGQPIEMLLPALCRKDGVGKPMVVVEPGMLRRARNPGE